MLDSERVPEPEVDAVDLRVLRARIARSITELVQLGNPDSHGWLVHLRQRAREVDEQIARLDGTP